MKWHTCSRRENENTDGETSFLCHVEIAYIRWIRRGRGDVGVGLRHKSQMFRRERGHQLFGGDDGWGR